MNTFSICALALIVCAFALILKKEHPVFAFGTVTATIAIIIIGILMLFPQVTKTLEELTEKAGINSDWLKIIIKTFGICFISQIACDRCRDSGETALASAVEFAGKITVFLITLPILEGVADTIFSLVT